MLSKNIERFIDKNTGAQAANMGFKSKGISTFPFSAYTGSCALIGSVIGAHIAIDLNDEAFKKGVRDI